MGGLGGGGNGGNNLNAGLPTAGAPNTGGGGGGGGANGVSSEAGAAGGSGVVIIRYLDAGSGSLSQTFCGSSTISDLSMSGSNIQWFATESDELALSSDEQISTGTYYVSQSNNGCQSPRTAVSVTVNTLADY